YTFSDKPAQGWLTIASYIALAIILVFLAVFCIKNQRDRLIYPNKTSRALSLISALSVLVIVLYMFFTATKFLTIDVSMVENAEEFGPKMMSAFSLCFYLNAVLFLIDSVKVLQGKGYIHLGMVAAMASMHLSFAYADMLSNMESPVSFLNRISLSTAIVMVECVAAVISVIMYTKKHVKNA
ncbi:MAG: hypothetical protein IK068_05580, partial [Lachnospiraceae bacterium]|nr:hypothetical protein [Lachnospiraceae bacterium]